ncbi:MAG TPA: hypothetical protein VGG20_13115 [Thermoanaerobaculia bacterium]
MTSPDLDRIRFVTRHFNELKGGLSLAALGLFFLSPGAAYIGRSHYALVFYLRIALIFGAAALMLYAKTHYQKRFGEVLARREEFPREAALSIYGAVAVPRARASDANTEFKALMMTGRLLLMWVLGILIYVGLRMAGPAVPSMSDPLPIFGSFATVQQLMDIVLGVLFLSTWIWRGRGLSQGYYLALALLILAIPALGATQGFILPALRDHGLIRMARILPAVTDGFETNFLLYGASCLLAGLLDHRQLVRTLKPAAAEG